MKCARRTSVMAGIQIMPSTRAPASHPARDMPTDRAQMSILKPSTRPLASNYAAALISR